MVLEMGEVAAVEDTTYNGAVVMIRLGRVSRARVTKYVNGRASSLRTGGMWLGEILHDNYGQLDVEFMIYICLTRRRHSCLASSSVEPY